MQLDYGRKLDLDQLIKARQQAKSSDEKAHYEGIMRHILEESEEIRYLREDLLKACRISDLKAMERIRLHIQEVRLRETNGASWGNQRGNTNGR